VPNSIQYSRTIYCDESGFTGRNLLDKTQPYFTYATVLADRKRTSGLRRSLLKRAGLGKRAEAKFDVLSQTERGRSAVGELLREMAGEWTYCAFHKEFALAGKMVEYLYEPAIDNFNPFYAVNFHTYVQQLIYTCFLDRTKGIRWANAFQDFMRLATPESLDAVIELAPTMDFARHFALWVQKYRGPILKHAVPIRASDENPDPWALDLTTTSLFVLLSAIGEDGSKLSVTYDRSVPIDQYKWVFDGMVVSGRTRYVTIGSITHAMGFTLARPLTRGNSRRNAGLQIADVCAGAARTVLEARHARRPKHPWEDLVSEATYFARAPAFDEIHPSNPSAPFLYHLLEGIAEDDPPPDGGLYPAEQAISRFKYLM